VTGDVRYGVAGWSYPDWRDRVYPKSCKDTLRFVADYVDFIEVNSTFYGTPDPRVVEGWLRRTAHRDGFFFTAKLPREVTHQENLAPDVVEPFRAALQPAHDAGRLRALLAQFSYRLVAGERAFELLAGIAAAFSELAPLVLEVRHRSWRDAGAQAIARSAGFALAHLDYPGSEGGFAAPDDGAADALVYLRLHGRNRSTWFSREAGRDAVYDWIYSPREVEHIDARIERALEQTGSVLVVANNHFEGKAMKVLVELAARRRGKVPVPPLLVELYPELRALALAAE